MIACRIYNRSSTKILGLSKNVFQSRALSNQAEAHKTSVNLEDEWSSAKSFEELPKLSKFQLIRRMLPGGQYHGLSIGKIHEKMRDEIGEISWFPAMLGRPGMVLTMNPADFEKVFRNEGIYPYRRFIETLEYYRTTVRPDIYGEFGSLVTDHDEKWQQTRTLVNQIMMKPQTTKLYVPQVDEIANEFIQLIKRVRDDKLEMPADFFDLVNQWSLESIACITLSRRLGLLKESSNNPHAKKLLELVKKMFSLPFEFEMKPSIWRYYQTKAFKELMQLYDQVTELLVFFVEEAIKEVESQPEDADRELSVLEKLLKVNKKLAVVMCADSLGAGVDTTSTALLTTLYCLAKNPEKQEKLREEVMRILPNKNDPLTVENMKNLPYLRAVFKEGLRVYPPGTGNLRMLDRDVVLSGYKVPKGNEVLMSLLVASRTEKNFKQAKDFIPERWMKSNTDPQCPHAKDSHPFATMPFGFGPRMCVGRRFAELELEAMMMRIISNFKIEWHHPDMEVKGIMINVPVSDMKFKLIDI